MNTSFACVIMLLLLSFRSLATAKITNIFDHLEQAYLAGNTQPLPLTSDRLSGEVDPFRGNYWGQLNIDGYVATALYLPSADSRLKPYFVHLSPSEQNNDSQPVGKTALISLMGDHQGNWISARVHSDEYGYYTRDSSIARNIESMLFDYEHSVSFREVEQDLHIREDDAFLAFIQSGTLVIYSTELSQRLIALAKRNVSALLNKYFSSTPYNSPSHHGVMLDTSLMLPRMQGLDIDNPSEYRMMRRNIVAANEILATVNVYSLENPDDVDDWNIDIIFKLDEQGAITNALLGRNAKKDILLLARNYRLSTYGSDPEPELTHKGIWKPDDKLIQEYFQWLSQCSTSGDPVCIYYSALYHLRKGDTSLFVRNIELASEAGLLRAQIVMRELLMHGGLIPKDENAAVRLSHRMLLNSAHALLPIYREVDDIILGLAAELWRTQERIDRISPRTDPWLNATKQSILATLETMRNHIADRYRWWNYLYKTTADDVHARTARKKITDFEEHLSDFLPTNFAVGPDYFPIRHEISLPRLLSYSDQAFGLHVDSYSELRRIRINYRQYDDLSDEELVNQIRSRLLSQ